MADIVTLNNIKIATRNLIATNLVANALANCKTFTHYLATLSQCKENFELHPEEIKVAAECFYSGISVEKNCAPEFYESELNFLLKLEETYDIKKWDFETDCFGGSPYAGHYEGAAKFLLMTAGLALQTDEFHVDFTVAETDARKWLILADSFNLIAHISHHCWLYFPQFANVDVGDPEYDNYLQLVNYLDEYPICA